MNADSFFAIGKTHKVCQDYAITGDGPDGLYALLSDGCSSSPDTDIGARILVQVMKSYPTGGFRENPSAKEELRVILERMDLPLVSADATLLSARYVPVFDAFNIRVAGDGVVAARRRDGSGFDLHVFEYPSGAPEYPSYHLDPDRHKKYLEEYGCVLTSKVRHADGVWSESFQDFEPSILIGTTAHDLILLMSDGAQSFQRMVNTGTSLTPEKVPVEEVVEQIMKVKGTKGEFITRRCQRFLKRFCTKNGWTHADDFSVAAIWMGES